MEKDAAVSDLTQGMGELKVEEEKPQKVLESLTVEGVVKLLEKLQASEDSKSVYSHTEIRIDHNN